MANAIRELALRHGEDPQRFALVPFGGAAGQHACAVAELLGIDTLLLHPLAGVLSAWGIGLAQRPCIRRRSVESPLDAAGMEAARTVLKQLADDARGELIRQRVAPGTVTERLTAHLRLAGSDTTLEIAWADEPGMRTAFREAHERLYGFAAGNQAVVIAAVSVGVAAHGTADLPPPSSIAADQAAPAQPPPIVPAWIDGGWGEVPLHARDDTLAGERIAGPALVSERGATGWIAPVIPGITCV